MSSDDLDEAERPRPSGTLQLRPDQLGPGEHLRMVHDHLRGEVSHLVMLVDEVLEDDRALPALTDAVAGLSMRDSFERFGTFCNMTCRMLNMHHRIEDAHVFPTIARQELYAPLAAKLMAEHEVIHTKLIAVDTALEHAQNRGYEKLSRSIHDLQQALFSHLGYEDEQLPEPLGVLGMG